MTLVADALKPAFADPVHDAQRTFRVVLEAMARPGSVWPLHGLPRPPAPLSPAAAAVCLTLCDLDAPLWIDPAAIAAADYLRFHTGAPVVDVPADAAFVLALAVDGLPPLNRLRLGEPDYPDRSATVVVQVSRLVAGDGWRLSGPGIETTARLMVADLPDDFPERWAANHALFPLGVDLILAAPDSVAALPRTTRLER